jgi:DNA-binding CsgD family transcriptional regulator/tetratricopeptide (TPR) repeat protein
MRLGPAEVEHMLAVLGGHEVAPSFAGAVYEQTDGNPLFVQEVYRDLVEAEQRVSLTEQAVQPAQRTPAGLRHVIAMRLSRLSPACNQLLTAAAVIGRTFSLGTLQRVVALDDESLFTALETAVRVGLLEEQTGPGLVRYRFAHALFRQTLYEDLIAPRRLRLHQQVVRALEDEYGARVEEHAAELAAHYAQSTSSNDLAEAIRYWRMAAARANRACAYSDAARYLEEALSIQKAVDPDDLRARCDLLLALAHALGPAGEPQRAADIVAEEAFRLAEAIGDDERASYACFIHFEAASRYGARLATRGTAGSRWAERADRHAPLGSLARIYADLALGDASYVPRMGDDPGRSWRLHQRALEAARAMDDPRLLLECAAHMLPGGRLGYWTEALRLAQEVAALPLDGISAWTAAISLQSCGAMFLAWGQRDRAERLWRSLGELADQTPDPAIVAHAVVHRIILATLDGDLQAAVDATERFEVLAAEAGGSLRGLQFSAGYGMRALSYLGRMEAALESVQRWAMLAPRPSRDTRLGVALAQVGRWDQAQEILDRILARWRARPPGSDIVAAHVQQVLELAILLRDQSGAAFVSGLLAPVAHIINDRGCDLTCIARHLGDAAALLGDVDQASEYYDHALEMCRRVGFRPEIALIHLGIAELGVRDPRHPTRTSPRQRAARSLVEPDLRVPLDHLDFAIQEFQAMGMRPALERALAFRGAARPDTATPSQSTYPGKLTEREVAVLRLIAVGKRNREIATALSLSPHTVAHHITSVLTKTGAANRAEAASYATRHGLVRGA